MKLLIFSILFILLNHNTLRNIEFTHVMLKECVKLAALSAEQPDP